MSNFVMYFLGITKEIKIPMPWGFVAAKVYGNSTNPPVLCLHGWLDNCNTFDMLVPLLPKGMQALYNFGFAVKFVRTHMIMYSVA